MSNENKAIYFINDGAGVGQYIDAGCTVSELLEAKQVSLGDYQIRVNGESVMGDYVIKASDRISVSPTKMSGA